MKRSTQASFAAVGLAGGAALTGVILGGVADWATTPGRDTQPASIEGLAVATDMPMDGYSRGEFGDDWTYHGSGCDTREIVLRQQAVPGTYVAGKGCAAVDGEWLSRYTSVPVTDSSDVDIDHVVPLAEAWRSGASAWPVKMREAFANDLTRPQLWAVDASSNRSKGDRDPSAWMPDQDPCGYAQAWIAVKSHWRLTIDPAEHAALDRTLAGCNGATP